MGIKTKVFGAVAAATIVGAGIIGAAGVASAQEPTPTANQPKQERNHQLRDNFLGRVATNLGISLDQLRAGFKSAEIQTVDQMVADGTLTADQAAKLKDKINSGDGFGIGRFLKARHDKRADRVEKVKQGLAASAATALRLTPAQLRDQLKTGKSIAEIATAQGVDLGTVKAQITADAKTKLDKLVAAGTITQAREDSALQKLVDGLDAALNKTHTAKT